MAAETAKTKTSVRLAPPGAEGAHAETGVPVLDRLLEQLARYGRFELTLSLIHI